VTHALAPLELTQYSLHQWKNGELLLTAVNIIGKEAPVRQALATLFGTGVPMAINSVDCFSGKVIQYTRDV
jgi:hypothetical protein